MFSFSGLCLYGVYLGCFLVVYTGMTSFCRYCVVWLGLFVSTMAGDLPLGVFIF